MVSPVFRAVAEFHEDMSARRVQTRAYRAPPWAGDPPPLRPPLLLLPRSRRRAGLQRSAARKRGFSKSETAKIVETVLHEEGRPPESVFDFVQGITALARGKAHQDARLELEGRAKRLLERAN